MSVKKSLVCLPVLGLLAACAMGGGGADVGGGPVVGEKQPKPPVTDDNSRLLALSVGAVAGSQLGGNVGRQLTGTDRARMQESTQRALETGTSGEAVFWNNADSGNSGSTTPQARFTTSGGTTCREFQQSITVGGENATAYGTACRQPDGHWMVVSG